jgi:hypothetical protein
MISKSSSKLVSSSISARYSSISDFMSFDIFLTRMKSFKSALVSLTILMALELLLLNKQMCQLCANYYINLNYCLVLYLKCCAELPGWFYTNLECASAYFLNKVIHVSFQIGNKPWTFISIHLFNIVFNNS